MQINLCFFYSNFAPLFCNHRRKCIKTFISSQLGYPHGVESSYIVEGKSKMRAKLQLSGLTKRRGKELKIRETLGLEEGKFQEGIH